MGMDNDFITEATAIIDRLRSLDRRRVVFGATHHAYRFNEPIQVTEVERFERTHGVSLPVPYRRFIAELGNGGAGPYYGIMPLELDAPQLLEPFPYTEPFTPNQEDEDLSLESDIPGTISIAEYGCGIYILLVVRGFAAGQVWVDARFSGKLNGFIGYKIGE
jgi:hypothetical protein